MTLTSMYDVLVLAPGGGWATDTTGSKRTCLDRIHWLSISTRGRRQITRLMDSRTGETVRPVRVA